MMKPKTMKHAVEEARRFMRAVDQHEIAVAMEPGTHPRESAAVRRASMDLTRALADMRAGR